MWVEIIKYIVPIIVSGIFFYGIYEISSGKDDPKKMGLAPNILNLFGAANVIMAVCWLLILLAHVPVFAWLREFISTVISPRELAIFITGMFLFDYIVSLAIYKNVGDSYFKYYGGVFLVMQIAYSFYF